jgi:ABC-type sugar transport system ATPase subunit
VRAGATAGAAAGAPLEARGIPGGREDGLDRLWSAAPAQRRTEGRDRRLPPPATAVSVNGLAGGELRDFSFEARPGEIVGFAGLRGSGVEELPRMLSGDLRWRAGRVDVGGTAFTRPPHPRDLIHAGVTAIQADRLRAGGVPSMTVQENVVLPALSRYWHRAGLRDRVVDSVIKAFDVRPPTPEAMFGRLSGGNQQKVLLGKWLLLRPSVLVLGDPTYGVDPAAREAIFAAVQDAAERGVCVLFFSTEPEQLIRVCSRVLVLRNGGLAAELTGSDLTLENVVEWSEQ